MQFKHCLNEHCILASQGISYKVNKFDLLTESDYFVKEFFSDTALGVVFMNHIPPKILRFYAEYLNKKTPPKYENDTEYILTLRMVLEYRLSAFYLFACVPVMPKFILKHTFLPLTDLAKSFQNQDFTNDLFRLAKTRLNLVGEVLRDMADFSEMTFCLNHLRLDDPLAIKKFVIVWMKRDAQARSELWPTLLTKLYLGKFAHERLEEDLQDIGDISYPGVHDAFLEKMTMDQIHVLLYSKTQIQLYAVEEFGYIVQDSDFTTNIDLEILKVFLYRDLNFVLALQKLKAGVKNIILLKRSFLDYYKVADLAEASEGFLVSVVGQYIYIVIPWANNDINPYYVTKILAFNVVTMSEEFTEDVAVEMPTNSIQCTKKYIYLMHKNKCCDCYDNIVRYNISSRSCEQLNLRELKRVRNSGEMATCFGDKLFIIGYEIGSEHLFARNVQNPSLKLAFYIDNSESGDGWERCEVDIPWNKFEMILHFQEDSVIDKNTSYIFPFVCFLADDDVIYFLNPITCKFKTNRIRWIFPPPMYEDKIVVFVHEKI